MGRMIRPLAISAACAALWAGAACGAAARPEPPRQQSAAEILRGTLPLGVRAERDITYATVEGRSLKLDLYLPEAPADGAAPKPDKRPVVVWIHGGGWEGGSKEQCPAAVLVPKGYCAVSVGYRLTGVAPFPAQIHDCKAAVRWVRANADRYGFDAERVGVWGASAGGHLAALMGTSAGDEEMEGRVGTDLKESSRVQAVCDWFGPTDLVKLCRLAMTIGEDDGTKGTLDKDGKKNGKTLKTPRLFRKLFGGELDETLEVARSANPIVYVEKSDPPVLIMHGDKDPLVPLTQSEELEAALKAAGVPVELTVVKGGGHGFWNEELLAQIVAFFDAHLKQPAGE